MWAVCKVSMTMLVLKDDRKNRILAILQSRESARTCDIASELGISRETVRRDLLDLHAEGLLQRIHGGATLNTQITEKPFQVRMSRNRNEKLEIGRKAVDLLPSGAAIFLDAGSTTAAFAEVLRDRGSDIKVTTNLQSAAQALGQKALLLGGRYSDEVPATFCELTLANIRGFYVDYAVISPTAIHLEHGLTYYKLDECEVARAMVCRAKKTIVLADSSKFGVTSRVRLDDIGTAHVLVTNTGVAQGVLNRLRASIAEII